MSGTGGQLTERNELFSLNHLFLNVLQVIERFARGFEQARPVAVDQALAKKR